MKIAITGGMGCGKSAAMKAFLETGRVRALFADDISREILENDVEVRLEIERLLGGAAFVNEEGKIVPNKKFIAQKIFSDESLLSAYENIIHPPIIARILNFENISGASAGEIIAVEIPLLYEKKLEKFFDICLSVFCSEEIRLKRLQSRGMSLPQILERDAHQLPPARKAELADVVLFNESDVEFLKRQAHTFISRL